VTTLEELVERLMTTSTTSTAMRTTRAPHEHEHHEHHTSTRSTTRAHCAATRVAPHVRAHFLGAWTLVLHDCLAFSGIP
jgi:hypothetical protein